MSDKRYVAVVGCQHYFGFRIFRPGMLVGLKKEPDNEYDQEAIKAVIDSIGKVGYVANSPYTVPMGCQAPAGFMTLLMIIRLAPCVL